ncbi:MAG: hypothetical protein AB7J63_05240, partial [Vicinamibacterales bacterium]
MRVLTSTRRPLSNVVLLVWLIAALISCGGNAASNADAPVIGGAATTAELAGEPASTAPATAQAVRALTGAHTRLVWVQSSENDPTASGTSLVLMGMDTDDGRGERAILEDRGSYIKPLFVDRAQRVLFTRHGAAPHELATFIVNWDGSGLRRLANGAALAVVEDSGDRRNWVYVGTDNSPGAPGDFGTVSRFSLDAPDARELVWNKTPVSGDTFQVSSDGRIAGGLFPWPHAGVADLPNGNLRLFGEGCWTALRDAGVGLFWYLDGSHRNVTMVDRSADRRWTVPLNQAPGFDNPEVYHPRWANHPRFVALSGPYNQGGTNQVRTGGAQTEIYLGRFSTDYSRVEAWARATQNAAGDSYPDVWIDREQSPHPAELARNSSAGAPAAVESRAGRAPRRIVVDARLTSAAAVPSPRSNAPYRNAHVVHVFDVVTVVEGTYAERRVKAAQWAILDARVLDAARRRTVGST